MSIKDTQETMDKIVETAKYVGGLEAEVRLLKEASALEKVAQAVLDGRVYLTPRRDFDGVTYAFHVRSK